MKTFLKRAPLGIFGLLVGFYATFVMQTLWNWFVATTFNITQISYWQMYGLSTLVHMIYDRGGFAKEERWNRLVAMVYACVPADKKEQVDETLKEEKDSLWVNAGVEVFTKLVGNTVSLVFGWAVHTFLV